MPRCKLYSEMVDVSPLEDGNIYLIKDLKTGVTKQFDMGVAIADFNRAQEEQMALHQSSHPKVVLYTTKGPLFPCRRGLQGRSSQQRTDAYLDRHSSRGTPSTHSRSRVPAASIQSMRVASTRACAWALGSPSTVAVRQIYQQSALRPRRPQAAAMNRLQSHRSPTRGTVFTCNMPPPLH